MTLPSVRSAAAERTSSGQAAMRWLTSVSETTTSQFSNSVGSWSMRPARPAMFVPTSGKSSSSSFAASFGSSRTGSGSYSTETSSAASMPEARSSLRTTATMSPTKRTTSLATIGRRSRCSSTGIGGGAISTPSMSAPVRTWMFGRASAADASIPVMRACANGERTNVTVRAPSSGRFSTYVASPRRNRGSSFRRTRLPRMLIAQRA